MQKNDVTKLALKLAGIYVLVKAIQFIPSVVLSIKNFNVNEDIKTGSITLLVTLALLIILGLWLTLKYKPKFEKGAESSSELLTTGIAVAGIMVFALAISNLPIAISYLAQTSTNIKQVMIPGISDFNESLIILIGNLIQLALGALFFFKAKYFARLVK